VLLEASFEELLWLLPFLALVEDASIPYAVSYHDNAAAWAVLTDHSCGYDDGRP
jgi:hypothetical protein